MLKLYAYNGCSTCQNAMKWLKEKRLPFQEIVIRETPPTVPELTDMLKAHGGNLRSLFNTSGLDYRAMNLKEKLPAMTQAAALKLLSENGNLVKRPFAINEKAGIHLVGFREAEWDAAFNK